MAKRIDIDDMRIATEKRKIDPEIIDFIGELIRDAEQSKEVYINDFVILPISRTTTGVPLLHIEPYSMGRQAGIRLAINQEIFSGRKLADINKLIEQTSVHIARNLKEAIIHEIGHCKLIQGKSIAEIEALYEEIADQGVLGISEIAAIDGAEAIAEIEILISRGEKLSKEAASLYKKYIGG